MSKTHAPRPVVLCILDGWGHRDDPTDNAIALADTPTWDRLMATCPRALLATSGLQVGLPEGQMGNSEVGHMNLGAGRVVMQDLPRIDAAIADGSAVANPVFQAAVAAVKAKGGAFHLMGLMSPGGVHSHQDHLAGLAKAIAGQGVPVKVHAFLDGRDTPPSSAKDFMARFLADIAGHDVCVATVAGRYYAMDRDKRWDRVQLAFDTMMLGRAPNAADPLAAIQASYDAGKTDEFMLPVTIGSFGGMKDGDGLLMGNFRADRAREILHALVDPAFDGFARERLASFAARLGLTEYSKDLNAFLACLFPAETLTNLLGEVASNAGLTQLRIAETEKYAHVTFFFNGGREQVYPGEDRILVPSPKVATYDLQPEMSAPEVADRMAEAIGSGKYDLIVANFANGDMVGHTGILAAAMQAAQTVDACLAKLETAIKAAGGTMLVTADHGNAEQMTDPLTHQPHTAHTTGPVDALLVNPPPGVGGLKDGRLADVAPTLLALLGLPQPADMTGTSLLGG
ncbi:2,3-bisphosphoglycerate-independent phosphoglycerate mutase [Magnetospirillum moscoviense]|uniref:2,3-bisphosphoglycerate-independent phosphoglycerate mutase n=1 Tax=Magnetospirillum moscoviense TaxID=1437059 RepID=A0A178N152_9PROT|nr:2,3-bisphosphoglycerate-independent phosphoglycerate mutase [Magnetospirillum moscoviense]MBF0327114.1 2,3-bisphosphoglycerate-independent phosphoglycerate mutase [Alphaproteobacteria bacterium]OAN60941.1 phosphoglycerate mutase (2,3-diphosphoglycerate-independent) [Magnetospirillum moscoviense]